jgi:Flp pilus assembly protein TadD/DNA-binding response OmpR family regulator
MDERSSARPELAPASALRATPPKKPVRPNAPPTPRRASGANPLEPTILLVGADSAFEPALRAALARHKVYVETTLAESVAETVIAAAPDLVLLVGAAAQGGGSAVLSKLMSSPVCSVVPVAILDDDNALDMRLRAFRHGAAAVIAKAASMDAIAEQVAKLAREIPERGGESLGVVGEATLSEFVGALSRELRSGILSVRAGANEEEAVRLVLGSGKPLAAVVDDFVKQVKSHVVHAEPLHYEFAEHPSGTVALLDTQAPVETESASVRGVRVALADDDTGRADTVAQELRARGVSVVVTDFTPSDTRFAKLRQADPQVLLIGEGELKGEGYELLRRMRRDTRLRWVSLLVVRWHEIWVDALSVPALERLETAIAALSEADHTLKAWAETGESFDARLEITGPARCLRALSMSPRPLRITVNNPRITVSIDISDGLVVGASAESRLDAAQHWDGAVALSAFMVLSSGRVHVTPVNQPAVTNVMATVDVALNMADSEPSPIAPSIPSTAAASLRPPALVATSRKNETRARTALGRARTGVSLPTTVFLVALAALQGLLIVAGLSFVLKPRAAAVSTPRVPSRASLSSALVASPAPKAPPAAIAPLSSVVGEAAPAVPPTQPQPTPLLPPSAATSPAQTPLDESGARAPSCEQLLGATATTESAYPGAAFDQMRDANRALVRGDVDAAERGLCKAALWDQKNPAIPLELAQLMLLRRDGASAVGWAKKGLELGPADLRAQSILGDGLARLGDYDGAKLAWLKSMKLEEASEGQVKSLSFGSVREAQASLRHKDFARAERFFRRAVVFDGDNAQASNGLASALLKLGDVGSALRWANHAVSVAPRDPAARVILGDILFQKGDRTAAEVEWREALQIDPTYALAQLHINKLNNTR